MIMSPPFSDLIQNIYHSIQAVRPAKGPTLVAIDGPGCSGKSTLANALEAFFDNEAITVGTDSFFIPFAEQDLCWDPDEDISTGVPHLRWRELEDAVIGQLLHGRAGRYQ